jgi:hypothetical protein
MSTGFTRGGHHYVGLRRTLELLRGDPDAHTIPVSGPPLIDVKDGDAS